MVQSQGNQAEVQGYAHYVNLSFNRGNFTHKIGLDHPKSGALTKLRYIPTLSFQITKSLSHDKQESEYRSCHCEKDESHDIPKSIENGFPAFLIAFFPIHFHRILLHRTSPKQIILCFGGPCRTRTCDQSVMSRPL